MVSQSQLMMWLLLLCLCGSSLGATLKGKKEIKLKMGGNGLDFTHIHTVLLDANTFSITHYSHTESRTAIRGNLGFRTNRQAQEPRIEPPLFWLNQFLLKPCFFYNIILQQISVWWNERHHLWEKLFILICVPFSNSEEAGFMTYTAANHHVEIDTYKPSAKYKCHVHISSKLLLLLHLWKDSLNFNL